MKEVLKDLASRVLVASGAQGTELEKRGFSLGDNYAAWGLKHPDALKDIILRYVDCGIDILSASCSSSNRFRLEHFGLGDQAYRLSREMVELTKKYCPADCYVGGSLSDIGHLLEPLGDVSFEAAYDSYTEQVLGMAEGGVDFVWIMTMTDVKTTEAAVKAIKENSDLPVFASMAFDSTPKGPRTMMGVSPAEAAEKLDRAGADAIGLNCGGILMDEVDAALKEMARVTRKPLISKPNAGIPNVAEGETTHPVSAEEMARHVPVWIDNGAKVVSGCCGSGPDHIARISEAVKKHLRTYQQ
jgi:5-methyltetrahydrofolate--homocysteine methyltransferase